MNSYFSALFSLFTFFIGLLAKPFQDWILCKLNRNENNRNKKEKIIEELFMLLPAINDKINAINNILVFKILGTTFTSNTNNPANSAPYLSSIIRIKYLLKIELLIPDDHEIWNLFTDYDLNCDMVTYLILHEPLSKIGMAPATNPLNQIIEELIESNKGDHTKTAIAFIQRAKSKTKELTDMIEQYLKQEKQKLI